MTILRNAFVKVTPDTSKFDKELKDKLKKTDVGPEGDKVGKAFSSSLTRRIDRELNKFDLPKLDLTANPADALKAIEATSRKLEGLRDDADSIELRLQATKALGDLGRFRKTLGDAGPSLGATLGVSTSQGFFASLSATFAAPPPAVYAGAGLLAAALTPTLAAGVAGAVVGGVGVGGVIGGVTLAARDERVKAAGSSLGAFILGDLTSRASGFTPVVLDAIDDIRSGWALMGSDLDRIFASSRFVEPLVAGGISGARKLVAGFADVMDDADPVVFALGASFDRLGDAVGDVFSTLAQDADEGASAIDDLTGAVASFVRVTGGIIHAAAVVKGWTDQVDTAADRTRYWIEDNSFLAEIFDTLGGKLDLTADGFAAGSVEAEAYRKATIGTATAADFATLKLAGMTDGEIAAADASGTFRAKTDEVNAALGRATGTYIEHRTAVDMATQQTQLLGDVQSIAAQEMDALLTKTGSVTGAMDAQRTMADLLRHAHERMFGAIIAGNEANEGYEASWDDLSGSVERNGGSLSIHTEKGRNNRDALEDLITSSRDLAFAEIETGTSVEGATKKHEGRIKAIKEEAHRLGLNKTETEKLIEVYGRIPPKKGTDVFLDGLERLGRQLTDLYIFQRSLATGRTLAQVRSDLFGGYAGDPRAFKAEGGPIPGHSPSDTADNIPIMATADEYMIRRSSARKLGRATLDYINQRGELPPGYARGGSIDRLLGKQWGSRSRYRMDLSDSYVMSKADAANKVIPAAPSGGATAPWMVQVLRQAFPALQLVSGFRPGSRTLSGNLSYHALNRAVDYAPDRAMARWVFSNYRSRTKEFISPFQEYNLLNGRPHRYSGAVWNQHNFAGGNAHNHWAMAGGGVIPEPVFGVGASGRTYSFGEVGPETVTPGVHGPAGGDIHLHFHGPVASKQAAEDMVVAAVQSAKRKRRL